MCPLFLNIFYDKIYFYTKAILYCYGITVELTIQFEINIAEYNFYAVYGR